MFNMYCAIAIIIEEKMFPFIFVQTAPKLYHAVLSIWHACLLYNMNLFCKSGLDFTVSCLLFTFVDSVTHGNRQNRFQLFTHKEE